MVSRPGINRRLFLKGLGGAMVALPALEILLDSRRGARAQTLPTRYRVCFAGDSLGADFDPLPNEYVPDIVGPNYDLKRALAPLANYNNVKNEITVVSGLSIPTAPPGMSPGPGGRDADFHINSLSPLFSGVRSGPGLTLQAETSPQTVTRPTPAPPLS